MAFDINKISELYPEAEDKMIQPMLIHASTQAHNHNKEGLKFLKEIGVKRAVLARELSIDEIRELDIDIEKEV